MIEWLKGKKTHVGSILLTLLGLMYLLDTLTDGAANWMSEDKYLAIGASIAGLTGAAMRLAIKKAEA